MALKTRTKVGLGGGLGAMFLAAAIFITPHEGLMNRPYRDIVGVKTVCIGETEGVEDRFYSDDECKKMLAGKLPRYYREIAAKWGPEVEARMTDNMKIAFLSLAYNIGSGAVNKSTAMRRLKAGDFKGACEAIGWFNKAKVRQPGGGYVFRVVKGLDTRRKAEVKKCLTGL